MAPATLLVTIVMLLALAAGLFILARAVRRDRRSAADERLGTQAKCPNCRTLNDTHARFCSRCGQALN